jgi:formate dehydrogenase major subunit
MREVREMQKYALHPLIADDTVAQVADAMTNIFGGDIVWAGLRQTEAPMFKFKLPLFGTANPARPAQPFSGRTLDKHARIRGATVVDSICPYCAVGCATQIHVKGGEVIDIEGNPNSPINEGTLCPKGANVFQLHHNPHRTKVAKYRAPYSTQWQTVPLEWALDQIASRVKETRDEGYREKNEDGERINAVTNMGSLGGATLDNEENYLMKKLFSAGLQILSIENQARI